jgi:hypothetical protein
VVPLFDSIRVDRRGIVIRNPALPGDLSMNRRRALLLASLAVMVLIATLAAQKQPRLLLLDWAAKAPAETPPTAILVELGLSRTKAGPWSGTAAVTGAKVVRREGYGMRDSDKLVEPDGWQITSRKRPKLPKGVPGTPVSAIAGVVLHLTDVKEDAPLTLDGDDKGTGKARIRLKLYDGGKPFRDS